MTATMELKGTRFENSVRDAIVDYGYEARYAPGENIFEEGEPSEKVWMLVRGEVAIEMRVPGHEPVRIATIEPNEIFGWSSVLSPRLHGSTARVVEPAEVLWVSGERMRDLAAEDSRFGFDLYRAMAELIPKRMNAVRTGLVGLITSIRA